MAGKTMAKKPVIEEVNEEKINTKVEKPEKRVFADDELIMCKSLVSGLLFVEGERSKITYTWADYGDEIGVEYRDLIYLIRQNNVAIYEPRIIIEDEDVYAGNKKIEDLYSSLYSVGDFQTIIAASPANMKSMIESLPRGAKEAFKSYVAAAIDSRALDSVSKIKAIDEVFGTDYLLTLTEN